MKSAVQEASNLFGGGGWLLKLKVLIVKGKG